MAVLILAYYDLRRLTRTRMLAVFLLVLPVAAGLVRLISASPAVVAFTNAFPFICAALIGAVVLMQRLIDRSSGLLAGIRSTPLSEVEHIVSRVLTGGALLAAQMLIFYLILAFIPH